MIKSKLLIVTDTVQARILRIHRDSLELLIRIENSELIHVDDAKRKTVSGLTVTGSVPGGAWERRNTLKDTARKLFCIQILNELKAFTNESGDSSISIIADPKMLGELRKHLNVDQSSHVISEFPKDVAGFPLQRLEEFARSKEIIS